MRSLFLRIFVFYWVATGLVMAIAVSTVAWAALERLRDFDNLEPATLSDSAAAALAKGGRAGLLHWTKSENSSIASPNIYVVDQTGHDLLGRQIAPYLLHRAVLAVAALRAGKSWTRSPRYAAIISDPPNGADPRAGNFLLIVTAAASGPLAALGDLRVLGVVVMLALGVTGLVCWLVARTISRPVVQLQASARSLASGDLNTRVGPKITNRRDELGDLARDFDLMAEKLRLMLASKETLMRDLSHELRSPLARLRIALGLARAHGATAETQFSRIEREAERMDLLIGQLLRLSRLMNIELRPQLESVDLSSLVEEIVEDARLEAMGTHKSIDWRDPGEVRVQADIEMIRHAIENVVRNALRFSPDDGLITVVLTRAIDCAIILVQDQGPGVPDAELTRIFEPFYRAQNSEGTGVGLAIAAQVMSLHGGSVVARNRESGGLEVEFRLRLLS